MEWGPGRALSENRAKGWQRIEGGPEFRIRDKNEIMWSVTWLALSFPARWQFLMTWEWETPVGFGKSCHLSSTLKPCPQEACPDSSFSIRGKDLALGVCPALTISPEGQQWYSCSRDVLLADGQVLSFWRAVGSHMCSILKNLLSTERDHSRTTAPQSRSKHLSTNPLPLKHCCLYPPTV